MVLLRSALMKRVRSRRRRALIFSERNPLISRLAARYSSLGAAARAWAARVNKSLGLSKFIQWQASFKI